MAKQDLLDKGAILQRDGETYAVTPRIPCGLITDFDFLRTLADVAQKYQAKALKVTSSQRIAIIGLKEEDLDHIWRELGVTPGFALGLCIRSIKACPGTSFCRIGMQDSLGLGLKLEEKFSNLPTPNKLKISVSGCPMDCAEAHIRDIGIIGNKKGYTFEVGGAGGPSPRIAQRVATGLTAPAAEELVQRVIDVYRQLDKRKRLGKVIKAIGLEEFKSRIGL